MAKTARKTRKAKGRRQAKSGRRVSTRRLPPLRRKRSSRKTTATRAFARMDAALETLEITLELRDVSGRSIRDPEAFFTFRRLSDHRQIGDQLQLELVGAPAGLNRPVATGRSQ